MSENKIVLIKEDSKCTPEGPYFGNLQEGTIFQSARETHDIYFYIKSGNRAVSLKNGTAHPFLCTVPVVRLKAGEYLKIKGRGDLDV